MKRFDGLLNDVLVAMTTREDERSFSLYRSLVEDAGPPVLKTLVPSGWTTLGGARGKGNRPLVPWMSAFPPGSRTTPQEGYYLTFLFAADGSALYCSLEQNADRQTLGSLRANVVRMRQVIGPMPDFDTSMDLRAESDRPKKYEAGCVYAVRYERGAIPEESVLKRDIDRVVDCIQTLQNASFKLGKA